MRLLPILGLLLLAGCGGSALTAPSTPVDETLRRDTEAGRLAYDLEHPEEAVARYQEALTRAQARDDIKAIGDLGFNLAVAQLNANAPGKALTVARTTRRELERRNLEPFPALLLVEAMALYRTGATTDADTTAARAVAGAAADPDAAARATFLRGLIADERGDESGLAAAVATLKPATSPALRADAMELAARLSLRRADPTGARNLAGQAADLRRESLDYRGLARCLALQGEAARRGGDAMAAADLFLRAGRSAVAQGDVTLAKPWLRKAAALAKGQSVGNAARDLLLQLERNQS